MTFNDPVVNDWIDNATTAEILGAMEYAVEALVRAYEERPVASVTPLHEDGPPDAVLAAYDRYADHAPLREAVLAYAGECLKRVPNMTNQTLGVNVLRTLRRWTSSRQVDSTDWGALRYVDSGEPGATYPVDPVVWDDLAVDLPLVNEDELGYQVRARLDQICPSCNHPWVNHVDRDCATCTLCSQAVKG